MMRRTVTLDSPGLPLDAEPVRLRAPRRSAMGSIIGHTGFNVARYYTTHVFGALFPLMLGIVMFGWRALGCVVVVVGTTLLAGLVWRRIGARGHPLRPAQLLWFGVVLALMLPGNLLHTSAHLSPWPIMVCAALLMVMLCWAIGGVGSGRFHPPVAIYLLIAVLYTPQQQAHLVLQHNRLLMGDLLSAPVETETRADQSAWRKRNIEPGFDALRIVPPAHVLIDFTKYERAPDQSRVSLETVLRDYLPPMEDLVLGAVPGSIGVTSTVAVIIGGLFLLYRGLIDYRIPLLITATAWVAMLVLPIPAGMAEHPQFHWFPGHMGGVGWAMGVTLANYEVLASPLLFTAFFLAGSPNVRPLTRRGRVVYAITIGLLSAGFQIYLSVSLGSYLALLIAGLMTPMLDRSAGCRSLV